MWTLLVFACSRYHTDGNHLFTCVGRAFAGTTNTITIGFKSISTCQGIASVAIAIPAPVEREHFARFIISIANECVATICSLSTIKNRVSSFEFVIHKIFPGFIGIIVAEFIAYRFVVAKIGAQRFSDFIGVST